MFHLDSIRLRAGVDSRVENTREHFGDAACSRALPGWSNTVSPPNGSRAILNEHVPVSAYGTSSNAQMN